MRKCRKCKIHEVPENSKKFCDQCKIQYKACDNPGPKWKARYWSCKAW